MNTTARGLLFSVSLVLLVNATMAQESTLPVAPKSNKNIKPFLQDPIALSVFADQLVAYGDGKADPLALLLATKIKKEISLPPENRTDKEDTPNKEELQSLILRAKEMAGEREEVLKIAAQTEKFVNSKLRMRGLVDGSLRQIVGTIGPGRVFSQSLAFRGGEYTMVGLLLDSRRIGSHAREDFDLDLYVRSEQGGATICAEEGPGIPEKCAWTPGRTGNFVIDLVNRTGLETPFIMLFR